MKQPIELSILADGEVSDPETNSGVARGIAVALEKHADVKLRQKASVAPGKVARVAIRIVSLKPTRESWDRSVSWGIARPLYRSLRRTFLLRGVDRKNEFALHVRNFYFPSRYPYIVFLDTTTSLREREWPDPRMRRRHYALLQILERAYYRRAALVLVAGRYVRDELIRFYGVNPTRVFPVGAGCPIAPAVTPRSIDDLSLPVRLLFVGKEFERKGGHDLVAASDILFNSGMELELHVVGVDQSEVPQRSYITCYGRVRDKSQLSQIYADADLFCLPAHFEPYGLVILEAMAHGLPVIASDVDALPELVSEVGAGVTVPAGDPTALARSVESMVRSPHLAVEMSKIALKVSRGMTWENVANRVVDAIKQAGSS